MSDLQENELHIQVTKNSPGKRLRKAREDCRLSRKDIAERLHLSEQVIDAIERDDQDHLPAPAFVRGYLRGYAPLVSLDADSVIADYNNYFAEKLGAHEIKNTLKSSIDRKLTDKSKVGKKKAYLALVLCVLVGIGYFTGQESTDDISSEQEPAINSESNVGTPVENTDDANTRSEEGSLASAADAGTDLADSNSMQTRDSGLSYQPSEDDLKNLQQQQQRLSGNAGQAIVAARTDDGLTEDSGNNPGKGAENKDKSSRLSSRDYFDAAANGEGVSPSKEPDLGSNANPVEVGSLSLQFHADAWTEVYDARGDRLLYRLGREGRTYQVTGVVPFKVLLGNAKEVTVMLNGQLFDLTPFIRGQVARFLAGEKSAGTE